MPVVKYVSSRDVKPNKIYMEFKNFEKNSMEFGKPVIFDESTGEKLIIYAEDGILKTRTTEEGS